jgi:hypothetical protein
MRITRDIERELLRDSQSDFKRSRKWKMENRKQPKARSGHCAWRNLIAALLLHIR